MKPIIYAIALCLIGSSGIVMADPAHSIPRPLALGVQHYNYADADIDGSNAELSMNYTQLKLPIGKWMFSDYIFVPTLSLEQTSFEVKNDSNAGNPDLYTAKAQFMFIKKLDDKWMRIIQIAPSMHTDGNALDEDAYSLMGLAIWKYESSETSAWTMGVGANRLFGEYKPIPLISYQYSPSMSTQIDLGFPITKFEHSFNKNLTGFAAIKPVGGNWRFQSQTDEKVNVSYSSWIASSGVRFQFKPKMWASLELGQSLARKFDINDDDQTGEVDIENSPTIMFSIGLHP